MGRPRLHLTAESGWINDPLGLTYRAGTYHLYVQHVPEQSAWAPSCHWGHATSPDLLHWTEEDVVLAPGDGDGGCWSGSVVTTPDGESVLFYTSVATSDFHVGRVRTARPTRPDLGAWRKDPGVAVDLPDGVAAVTFRDPYVFADEGRWWMLVGAGLTDGTATALTYVSDDLASWQYSGLVASRHRDERTPVWTGAMWECPQLLRIGDRHLLIVSVWDADELHYVAAAVGRFADGRFTADAWHRLTWGPSYYAGSAFRDRDGRPGLVFWLRGVEDPAEGWSGAISLPYLLDLHGDRPVLVAHGALLRERGDAVPCAALDVEWRAPAPELRLVDETGRPVARLRRTGDSVQLDDGAGGPLTEAPFAGDVRVLLDGPVLEVVAAEGLVAVPVRGDYVTARPESAEGVRWWSLGASG